MANFYQTFQTNALSYNCKVWHIRSGKEHYERKNVQILVMKCVMKCNLCNNLLFDCLICPVLQQNIAWWYEKFVCLFTDNTGHEKDFLVIILTTA